MLLSLRGELDNFENQLGKVGAYKTQQQFNYSDKTFKEITG